MYTSICRVEATPNFAISPSREYSKTVRSVMKKLVPQSFSRIRFDSNHSFLPSWLSYETFSAIIVCIKSHSVFSAPSYTAMFEVSSWFPHSLALSSNHVTKVCFALSIVVFPRVCLLFKLIIKPVYVCAASAVRQFADK